MPSRATSKAAQYAAFDFLVTAHHLAEWSAEARGGALKEWRSYPDAALLGHIANGAKHFRVQRHHVAKDTEVVAGAFASNAFETTAFQTGKLTIYLESGQAEDVLPLARRLLAHWRSKVADSTPRCLTIHSSRSRFAARLNSGVRPLNGVQLMWNAPTDKPPNYIALGLCLGVAFGAAIGIALGNLAYGMGPGIAIGLAFGAVLKKRNASRSAGKDQENSSDGA